MKKKVRDKYLVNMSSVFSVEVFRNIYIHITCQRLSLLFLKVISCSVYLKREFISRIELCNNRLVPNRKRSTSRLYLSPGLFNFYAENIIRNAGLEEAQAGIKIAGRNINNLRYADDTTLMAESEEELNSLLMKVKEKSEKASLKVNIQKAKIMASGPITSWQMDGETMESLTDFIFLGSKITADGDCSHEIKRCLLLGRKAIDKPRWHIKKKRHHLADKGPYSQSYGFSSSHAQM